jgi:hypothetical protein
MEKIFTNLVKQLCLNFALDAYFLFLLDLIPSSTVPSFSNKKVFTSCLNENSLLTFIVFVFYP